MNVLFTAKISCRFEFLGREVVLYLHVSNLILNRATLKFIHIAIFLLPYSWLQDIPISFDDLQFSVGL